MVRVKVKDKREVLPVQKASKEEIELQYKLKDKLISAFYRGLDISLWRLRGYLIALHGLGYLTDWLEEVRQGASLPPELEKIVEQVIQAAKDFSALATEFINKVPLYLPYYSLEQTKVIDKIKYKNAMLINLSNEELKNLEKEYEQFYFSDFYEMLQKKIEWMIENPDFPTNTNTPNPWLALERYFFVKLYGKPELNEADKSILEQYENAKWKNVSLEEIIELGREIYKRAIIILKGTERIKEWVKQVDKNTAKQLMNAVKQVEQLKDIIRDMLQEFEGAGILLRPHELWLLEQIFKLYDSLPQFLEAVGRFVAETSIPDPQPGVPSSPFYAAACLAERAANETERAVLEKFKQEFAKSAVFRIAELIKLTFTVKDYKTFSSNLRKLAELLGVPEAAEIILEKLDKSALKAIVDMFLAKSGNKVMRNEALERIGLIYGKVCAINVLFRALHLTLKAYIAALMLVHGKEKLQAFAARLPENSPGRKLLDEVLSMDKEAAEKLVDEAVKLNSKFWNGEHTHTSGYSLDGAGYFLREYARLTEWPQGVVEYRINFTSDFWTWNIYEFMELTIPVPSDLESKMKYLAMYVLHHLQFMYSIFFDKYYDNPKFKLFLLASNPYLVLGRPVTDFLLLQYPEVDRLFYRHCKFLRLYYDMMLVLEYLKRCSV
ncbi:MAG: hypothetical protein GXO42_00770 [bacterium]|nr:hypothetical protein [bacterium]